MGDQAGESMSSQDVDCAKQGGEGGREAKVRSSLPTSKSPCPRQARWDIFRCESTIPKGQSTSTSIEQPRSAEGASEEARKARGKVETKLLSFLHTGKSLQPSKVAQSFPTNL